MIYKEIQTPPFLRHRAGHLARQLLHRWHGAAESLRARRISTGTQNNRMIQRVRAAALPRVLIGGVAGEASSSSPILSPAQSRSQWSLLCAAGLAFLLVGGADLALTWYPAGFGQAEWEFGTVTATLNGMPVLLLGLALVVGWSAAAPRRWVARGLAVALGLFALAIIAMAMLYATTIPLALKAVPDPLVLIGIKRAILKTAVQAVVYPAALFWMAVFTWRQTGRREQLVHPGGGS